jgi:hypothetical protein
MSKNPILKGRDRFEDDLPDNTQFVMILGIYPDLECGPIFYGPDIDSLVTTLMLRSFPYRADVAIIVNALPLYAANDKDAPSPPQRVFRVLTTLNDGSIPEPNQHAWRPVPEDQWHHYQAAILDTSDWEKDHEGVFLTRIHYDMLVGMMDRDPSLRSQWMTHSTRWSLAGVTIYNPPTELRKAIEFVQQPAPDA